MEVKLHESRRNPIGWVEAEKHKPIELILSGLFRLKIPLTIHWRKNLGMKSTSTFKHTLCFKGTGKSKVIQVLMNRDKFNAMLGIDDSH